MEKQEELYTFDHYKKLIQLKNEDENNKLGPDEDFFCEKNKLNNIRDNDKKTYDSLKNYQEILFFIKYEGDRTPFQIINNKGEFEDDNSDIVIKEGIKYYNYVEYPDYFIKMQNGSDECVMDSDEIVFAASYIKLLFNWPFRNEVIFEIKAKNKKNGFTNKELLYATMRYYNLTKDINYNYNINTGKMDINNGSDIFNGLWKEFIDKNAILGLQYKIDRKVWQVIFSDNL